MDIIDKAGLPVKYIFEIFFRIERNRCET